MLPSERDAAYLWDMMDAASSIRDFMVGINYAQYLADRKLQLAVERCLEIIGEAARCVSASRRQAHADIPWRAIIAQRNVLAHEYGDIKQERIWLVATEHIEELIVRLVPLIPPVPPRTIE